MIDEIYIPVIDWPFLIPVIRFFLEGSHYSLQSFNFFQPFLLFGGGLAQLSEQEKSEYPF